MFLFAVLNKFDDIFRAPTQKHRPSGFGDWEKVVFNPCRVALRENAGIENREIQQFVYLNKLASVVISFFYGVKLVFWLNTHRQILYLTESSRFVASSSSAGFQGARIKTRNHWSRLKFPLQLVLYYSVNIVTAYYF